ncbi:MAG: DMT family transporter [Rhodospirillales bacterium]|nr:DMT family transporter [Rhodospirillales bacterium]
MTPASARDPFAAIAPGLFVVLWSTGFIGAKYGLPYAEPYTFLFTRFVIVAAIMAAIAAMAGAPWPRTWREAGHAAVAGLLVHGVYLGGVFAAIHHGLSVGVTALVVGLQPLLTAVAAGPFLGERVSGRQWLGLTLGLAGIALVVAHKLGTGGGLYGLPFTVAALLGITAGTIYQKRHGGRMDLRTGAVIQFAASAAMMGALALSFETMMIAWSGEFVFALAWLTVILSVGAITLLYRLIRLGSASKVASLFYLVPPMTALIAFFAFGETLSPLALVGMAVAVVGVALATRG